MTQSAREGVGSIFRAGDTVGAAGARLHPGEGSGVCHGGLTETRPDGPWLSGSPLLLPLPLLQLPRGAE